MVNYVNSRDAIRTIILEPLASTAVVIIVRRCAINNLFMSCPTYIFTACSSMITINNYYYYLSLVGRKHPQEGCRYYQPEFFSAENYK